MIVELDGVEHEFPDDATDDEIRAALGGGQSAGRQPRPMDESLPFSAASPQSTAVGEQEHPLLESMRRRRHMQLAPTVAGAAGALAGGMAAGPVGARGGAALGGGLGRLLANEAEGLPAPKDLGGLIRAAGPEAAMQAGLEGAGSAITRGLGAFGGGLIKRAVGAPMRLRAEYPGLEQMLTKMRPVVGPEGTAAASAARRASGKETDALVMEAKRRGVKIDVERIAEPAIAAEQKAAARKLTTEERTALVKKVRARVQEILGSERLVTRPEPVTRAMKPTVAQRAKKLAQKEAERARKLRKETGAPPTTEALDDHIAVGLRAELERAVPEVAETNVRTQSAIGLERAMRRAELDRSPLKVIGGNIGPVTSAVIPSINVSRATASRIGGAIANPTFGAAAGQAPRTVAGLLEWLYGVPAAEPSREEP